MSRDEGYFLKMKKGPFFGIIFRLKIQWILLRTWCKKCKSISAYIPYWTIPIIGSQTFWQHWGHSTRYSTKMAQKWGSVSQESSSQERDSSVISSTAPPKDQDFHCSLKSHLWQPLTPPILHHWSLASAVPNDPSDPPGMYLRSGCLWLKLKWNKCCFSVNAGDMEDMFQALSDTQIFVFKDESLVLRGWESPVDRSLEVKSMIHVLLRGHSLMGWLIWIWGQVPLDA